MSYIANPTTNDCLMGRGGGTNHHAGNKRYRALTETYKPRYLTASRPDKPVISMEVVERWRRQSPLGRFLKQDGSTGLWYDVGDKKAREKTSQALREKLTYAMVDDKGSKVSTSEEANEWTINDEGTLVDVAKGTAVAGTMVTVYRTGQWTDAEIRTATTMIQSIGRNWKEVGKAVGRTENSVKNWWYNGQNPMRYSGKVEGRRKPTNEAEVLWRKRHPDVDFGSRKKRKKSMSKSPDEKLRDDLQMMAEAAVKAGKLDGPCAFDSLMSDGKVPAHQDLNSHSGAPNNVSGNAVAKSSSIVGALSFPVGYKFRRLLDADDAQHDVVQKGEVVDILPDSVRKVFYYESGTVEELTVSQLRELSRPKLSQSDLTFII